MGRESSKAWNRLWFGLTLGLVLYVMSVGPAVRIYVRTQSTTWHKITAAVYCPLILIDDTALGTALGGWVRWCCEVWPNDCGFGAHPATSVLATEPPAQ